MTRDKKETAFRLIVAMIVDDEATFAKCIALYPDYAKNKYNPNLLLERFQYEYEDIDFEDHYWFTFGEFACFLGRYRMIDMIQKKGGCRERARHSFLDWWCRCVDSASVDCMKHLEKTTLVGVVLKLLMLCFYSPIFFSVHLF